MSRPTILPTKIRATVPETFMVLHLRMRVVEEQTSMLLRDLEALSTHEQSLEHFHSKTSETTVSHPTISPVQARVAFVGESTLWKNCETLVNRMCRLESIVQTLQLNVFQLQTEKELNPKRAAQLEQRLRAAHEKHLQEMKIVQQEAMELHQRLRDTEEAEEKSREEVQRLSAALEITTASKMDAMIAAEELRNTKEKINCRLQELTEQLSREICLRESLEESQAAVMCHVQDMEAAVEAEQKQVQMLQQDCQELHKDAQLARVRLQEEEERTAQLEEQCTQLKAELDSKNRIISQLGEEAKNAQLSFSKQRRENLNLRSTMTALRETAEKGQYAQQQLLAELTDRRNKLPGDKGIFQDIQKFVMEWKSVQREMQVLLKIQQEVQEQNSQLQTQLTAERRQRQQLENQCQKLEKTVKQLKKYKEETERKLKEASMESDQITASLEAAHCWFKSKLDSLQLEAVKNPQRENPEESSTRKEEKKQ